MRVRRTTVAVAVVAAVAAGAGALGACGADAPDAAGSGPPLSGAAADGRRIAARAGCLACHSTDGSEAVGPTFAGAWGEPVPLTDGRTVTYDLGYLASSVRRPQAERRVGVTGLMVAQDLSDADLAAIAAYLEALNPGRAGG